jgi:uncharacterized protein (TIGR02246 family)
MGSDRATIEAFMGVVTDVWKTNDGPALADLFVEDGSLINPFGQRAAGRRAVGTMYSEYFAGMLRGSSTTIDVAHIRLVEADHAFVDGEQTIHSADGEPVLVVHLAALLRRDGGTWRFVDSRPFTFAALPT